MAARPRCGADDCPKAATHVLTVKKGASVTVTQRMPYCTDHGVIARALIDGEDDVVEAALHPLEA